ncbi:MAG TPA: DUF4382 domain-containing protein [Chryseosolibacter sp.]
MKKGKWIKGILMMAALLGLAACNDDEPAGKGQAEFEITDAPVDDANVKGVFVTVADIKVNGNSVQGFTKQTIDLKAYSEGKTKILGSGEFDARTYNQVVLVLDLDHDANGGSPGCYVLDQNNAKNQLKTAATGTTDVAVNKSWQVAKDVKTNIVLDFDLRKALRYSGDAATGYSFVSDNNLNAAVKLVAKANSGTVIGSYEESSGSNADKIIVYAYKKGTFNASTETTPQGADALLFANAAGSAEVKQGLTGNEFKLAFLEAGDYELHFVGYTKDTTTGRYQFQSQLKSETSVNGSVGNIVTVQSGATINVAAVITGIL